MAVHFSGGRPMGTHFVSRRWSRTCTGRSGCPSLMGTHPYSRLSLWGRMPHHRFRPIGVSVQSHPNRTGWRAHRVTGAISVSNPADGRALFVVDGHAPALGPSFPGPDATRGASAAPFGTGARGFFSRAGRTPPFPPFPPNGHAPAPVACRPIWAGASRVPNPADGHAPAPVGQGAQSRKFSISRNPVAWLFSGWNWVPTRHPRPTIALIAPPWCTWARQSRGVDVCM